jgi:hypothetical protein
MNTPQNTQDLSVEAPKLDWRLWAQPLHVVSDPAMTLAEKRELLASWASDARAVPNYPGLRQLETGHLVTIDSVLSALKRLDGIEGREAPEPRSDLPRRGHWSRISRVWRRRGPDDDDDGPSSPAPAGIWPTPPVLEGTAVAA